ncbi:MAG: hypothetical protein ACRDOO_25580, partial [Actinomadura sp.]
ESAAAGQETARGRIDAFDRTEDRLLAASPAALEGWSRPLVVAGVFGPTTAERLTGFARPVPLFPHDGELVLEATDADLLVVDAAAGTAGGPWAYLGEPGMYDREHTLDELLAAARARRLPVVLWGAGPVPGLTRLAWDAVGTPGVSLRRFNPGSGRQRDRTPLIVDPGPRLPLGVRRALEGIAAATLARVVTGAGPRELPELLRRHAVTVAATPGQVPEQLASGAFVLCPAAVAEELPADLHGHVCVVTDPATVVEVLAAAERSDPRGALRTLFLHHATPVRLAELCERFGIDADPLAGRRVTVVADVYGEADARRLADTLLDQAHRPVEVVLRDHADIPAGDWTAITDRLTERAVSVTVEPPQGHADARTPGEAPWVAPWPAEGEVPGTYLADLVCAAEWSAADAIGPATGRDTADYTFGRAIEPALVRRELHTSGGAATGWAAGGARLLSLDPRS